MIHLGVTAYHWSRQPPSRWVTEILAPAAARWSSAESARASFWYTVFDARAPHVFGIYSIPEGPTSRQIEGLGHALRCALEDDPLPVELSRTEIEDRHRACRGKLLCSADALPGLAEPNTLELFEHSPKHYPFTVLTTCPRPSVLWEYWGEVCSWARSRLGNGARSLAGILWVAAVEQELRRRPDLARRYWRQHAESLLPPLTKRLETEGEAAVVEGLPAVIGTQSFEVFDQVWKHPDVEACRELVRAIVELLLPAQAPDSSAGMTQLREINHVLGQQLMLPVRAQLPHLLYAWWRSSR